jgi:hypothetical protein
MPATQRDPQRPGKSISAGIGAAPRVRRSDRFLRDASITAAAWPIAVVGCVAHRFDH